MMHLYLAFIGIISLSLSLSLSLLSQAYHHQFGANRDKEAGEEEEQHGHEVLNHSVWNEDGKTDLV